jgi:hypothetical protein
VVLMELIVLVMRGVPVVVQLVAQVVRVQVLDWNALKP